MKDELVSRPPGNGLLLPGNGAGDAGGVKRSAAARCTRSTDHSHSRKEIYVWIRRREKLAAKSLWTRQAGIAATIHATGKCTKRFSKARDTRKSFFAPTAWKGKFRRREPLPLTCTDFWFYMAANTN